MVSIVGCVADSLQMLTTFVPGPNVIVYLRASVSIQYFVKYLCGAVKP